MKFSLVFWGIFLYNTLLVFSKETEKKEIKVNIKFRANVKINKKNFDEGVIKGIDYKEYSENFDKYVKTLKPSNSLVYEQNEIEYQRIKTVINKYNLNFEPFLPSSVIREFYDPLNLPTYDSCNDLLPNITNYFQSDVVYYNELSTLLNELSCLSNDDYILVEPSTSFDVSYQKIIPNSNLNCSVDIIWFTKVNEDLNTTNGESPNLFCTDLASDCRIKNQPLFNFQNLKINYLWENYNNRFDSIGDSVNLIHVDNGWGNFKHESEGIDLQNTLLGYTNADEGHGLKVLGLIKANINCNTNNPNDISGISPGVNIGGLVSTRQHMTGAINVSRKALFSTITVLQALKTKQKAKIISFTISNNFLPIESDIFVYDMIKFATHCLGITVIESAGNYSRNLDNEEELEFKLSRRRAAFKDSGAIIVGATKTQKCFTSNKNRRLKFSTSSGSNYGSRIDCFYWGQYIPTIFLNNQYSFNENTTGAGAIATGIAVTIQDYSIKKHGRHLTPFELRQIMCNNPEALSPSTNSLCNFFRYNVFSFKQPNYECLLYKVDKFFNPSLSTLAPSNCE